jgi:putative ABC transport system permease protein
MLENYFKIAIRNLLKNRLYSAINIFGLAVGLAAVIGIFLFLQFELRYDDFHADADRLYRIGVLRWRGEVAGIDSPVFTPPIGPAMKEEFPEVENYTRFSTERSAYVGRGEQALRLDGIRYADSTFFDLFSFELHRGDPQRVLTAPYSVVLTGELARQLFGEEDPVGQLIELDGREGYEVQGIVEDPPANSHFRFQMLISFSSLYEDPNMYMDWNGGNQYITFVRLAEDAKPEELESKLPPFMWEHINRLYESAGIRLETYLQPLQDIHLYHQPYSAGLRNNLYIFGAVGLLILFIACVNFVNLTTARAAWRAREVGVRKVMGAGRGHLARQFLGESLLLTFIALSGALFLVEILSPVLQQILARPFELASLLAGNAWLAILFLFVLVGLVAGSYPAFYLSSLEAVRTLKGKALKEGTNKGLSRMLVVLQFAISTALIACTLVVYGQLHFTQDKSLGFQTEQMLVLPLIGDKVKDKYETMKQELTPLPQVRRVTGSSEVPGAGFTSNGYIPEGHSESLMIHVVDIDEDFLETYDIDLLEGRAFSPERSTDRDAYLINEALARSLNWETPLGKTIRRNGDHRVIGMVEDFHFATLHSRIEPLIITNRPWLGRFNQLTLRLAPGPAAEAVEAIRRTWQRVVPDAPFDFHFLDENIDRLYRSEQRFGQAFAYASALSVFIALLGVLGLATFSIERRTKEIGIRKVLGATAAGIVLLFSRSYLWLVLISFVLAVPAAWWAMHRWLEGFAYHIGISWWMFGMAGALPLLFAFLTVGWKTWRAAQRNPVEALRYE